MARSELRRRVDALDKGTANIVGPAIWQTDKWCLPVFPTDADGFACQQRSVSGALWR